MGKNLKEAIAKNQVAAAALDQALRDCLAAIRRHPAAGAEARFQVLEGGRRARGAKRPAKM